jgi:hypothetical protein
MRQFTEKEIKSLDDKKIYSITQKVGLLASATMAKLYIHTIGVKKYYVVTRKGILNFLGDAQKAVIYGKKNSDYKEFKTAKATAKYLEKIQNFNN